ncbi:hypothetical protein ACJMK2_014335 [Sinanodonta woodiana]|uniref:Uncharacterized protein n=1 Tax=Sinanodonta woodiana TaxID=1069815 RepID=A0ABD3V2E2_SINWO
MAGRELYDFLNGRGVDTTKLEEEKSVIAIMIDEDLKEYVPKYGDRNAVLAFARRIVSISMRGGSSSEDRKRNLLMRLKDQLSSEKRNIAVGEDSNQSHGRYLSLIGNRNAKMVQRRLEVGW